MIIITIIYASLLERGIVSLERGIVSLERNVVGNVIMEQTACHTCHLLKLTTNHNLSHGG